jgi:hypothetical protein
VPVNGSGSVRPGPPDTTRGVERGPADPLDARLRGLLPRAGEKRCAGVDPSPVDRGKPGSGHHLIRDGSCTPLKVITTGGNVPAITEALALVDDVPSAAGRVGVGVRLALPRKTQAAPVPPGAPVTRVTTVGTSDASCPGVGSCLSSSLEASPTSAASASSATSSRGPSPRSTGSSASPPAGNDASTSTNHSSHSSHSSHSHAPSSTGGGSTSRHHDRVTSSEPRSTGRGSGRRPVDRPEVGPPAGLHSYPCTRGPRDYYYRQPGAPARHRCPDTCRRRALEPRIRREFRPCEPCSMERTSQYCATCGGQTYGALMFAVRIAHLADFRIEGFGKPSPEHRPRSLPYCLTYPTQDTCPTRRNSSEAYR